MLRRCCIRLAGPISASGGGGSAVVGSSAAHRRRRSVGQSGASHSPGSGGVALHAGTSAHFPRTAFVDPASQRTSNLGAKETKVFQLDEDVDALPLGHQGAAFERNYSWKKGVRRVKMWAEALKYTDPTPTTLAMAPALWGAGLAMTRLLVWDGADPVVLCAPFLPVHLVLFTFAGGFLIRGAIAAGPRWLRGGGPQCPLLADMASHERCALFGAHAAFSAAILLNIAPLSVGCAAVAGTIFGLSRCIKAFKFGGEKAPKREIWASSLACAMSAPAGYAAVAGRLDPTVTLPLFAAAVLWNHFHITLWTLMELREEEMAGRPGSEAPPPPPSRAASTTSLQDMVVSHSRSVTVTSSSIQLPHKKKTSGFRSSLNATGHHSDAVDRILPKLFQDTKLYWNVLLIPMCITFATAGAFSSQTLFFYAGMLIAIAYLQGIIDHVNIYDLWSTRMNYNRNIRFALILSVFIGLSNAFWGLATEHRAERDVEDSTTRSTDTEGEGTLRQILRMNIVANQRAYDTSDFSIADRFFRPAWVQVRVIEAQQRREPGGASQTEDHPADAAIPAWMRREYIGQNVGTLMRLSGMVSEERIRASELWWYERLDHYNVFAGLAL